MKTSTALLLGSAGVLAYIAARGTTLNNAVKKLQFTNPKIKLGRASLLNVPAEITIDVFNPTSQAVPVDYLAGNILYKGKQLSRFNVDGKAAKLVIKAQGTTKVTFTVMVSNINGLSTLTDILTNLFGGTSTPMVLQVEGIFYAMGLDLPFGFYYDVVKQQVVTPAIAGKASVNGIGSVKAGFEFGNNNEMEKYFTQRRMAKKVVFSKN